jgi:hypothetical protein
MHSTSMKAELIVLSVSIERQIESVFMSIDEEVDRSYLRDKVP